MRLLANENVNDIVVEALRSAGHDVLWIAEAAPGSPDGVVLALAQTEGRLLLTFDKDFGELAFRSGMPAEAGIVLFRVSQRDPARIAALAVRLFADPEGWAAHLTVVEPDRLRRIRLPASSASESPSG